jgi:hypothetical protein
MSLLRLGAVITRARPLVYRLNRGPVRLDVRFGVSSRPVLRLAAVDWRRPSINISRRPYGRPASPSVGQRCGVRRRLRPPGSRRHAIRARAGSRPSVAIIPDLRALHRDRARPEWRRSGEAGIRDTRFSIGVPGCSSGGLQKTISVAWILPTRVRVRLLGGRPGRDRATSRAAAARDEGEDVARSFPAVGRGRGCLR